MLYSCRHVNSLVTETSQPRITTFFLAVVCFVLCGRVCGLLFLLVAVVWWLFVVFLCAFIYGNNYLWFLLFFCVLMFDIYFFWTELIFFAFFLVFWQTLAGVLLLPSAGFLIIFCCVFCTYIYVYDYLWFLLFSVCFYLIFFVCLTKFMFFCFSCLLATLQVVMFLLPVACLMIVYCVFLCLHLYKDKSLFAIFGCGLFVCFLFFCTHFVHWCFHCLFSCRFLN